MCFDTAITVLFCWCFPLTAPEDARYRKFSWKIAVQIIILQSPHNNTLRVLLLSIHYEEYIYHSKDGKNWDCPLMEVIMGVFFSVKKKTHYDNYFYIWYTYPHQFLGLDYGGLKKILIKLSFSLYLWKGEESIVFNLGSNGISIWPKCTTRGCGLLLETFQGYIFPIN